MKTVTWYKSTNGLNVAVDSTRIEFNPKTGVTDLAAAWNIDVDRSGRVSRRKPHTKVSSAVASSLWSDGQRAFYVGSNGSLYEFFEDYTSRGLRSGLTASAPMAFENAGGSIFYCNGFENGVVRENASYSWTGSAYIGPESIWQITTTAPVGHLLSTHNAYMLIAQDNVIWWSMPFAYYHYRKGKDFIQMKSDITMMQSLGTGVWVSCYHGVYWLLGPDPGIWTSSNKASAWAIPGTSVKTSAIGIDIEGIGDEVVIWTASDGIYMGDNKGRIWNVTERRLAYQSSNSGAAVRIKNKYVVSLRP